MNHNINLKCEVCENIVRLKIYGGYVKKNSFSFACPECSVSISGNLIWNENFDKGFIKEFISNNATICKEEKDESHVLQIATEFYTDKIKIWEEKDITSFFSPFMLDNSSFELKQKKADVIKYTTDNLKNDFKISMRIWELYQNKNYKYLNRELLKYQFIEPVILGEVLKINYSSKIVEVLYKPFFAILHESKYYKKHHSLNKFLNTTKNKNCAELISLKNEFNDIFSYLKSDLIHLLNNFSNYYEYIWPIILSNIINADDINEIKEKKGILTTSFENLKNYYVEAFEILSTALPIFLGIQNIYLRGNKDIFEQKISKEFSNIKSILDYDVNVKNKGNKIKFFKEENIFSGIVDWDVFMKNEIRNSIGHYSYEYEQDEQLITFKDRNKKSEMYLIEFADILFNTFFATFIALEVVIFLEDI